MAPRRRPDPGVLEARLGYHFRDPDLLARALTHVSATIGVAGAVSYQRLEFLGDRVLGLAIADGLVAGRPDADEGDLSRRLSALVRRETCADVAMGWDVGPHLRLGPGEVLSGGRRNATILADACEAILGAIFLDGGYEAARAVIARDFLERTRELPPEAGAPDGRDAKSALQEWAQGRGLAPPRYELAERTGPDHAPRFVIAARLEGLEPALGRGGSKRSAEHDAARAMLAREGVGVGDDATAGATPRETGASQEAASREAASEEAMTAGAVAAGIGPSEMRS